MVEGKINLLSKLHYDKYAQLRFDNLVGLDKEKEDLLFGLQAILDIQGLDEWRKRHHKDGLSFLDRFSSRSPVVILSGDVGSGKTELALSVASPLSRRMKGETIKVFETPTDIRAGGYVGDISKRIAETFKDAKSKLKERELGILIIDEADDLATSREQMQAHHEDRAGVNVLIKELDKLESENGRFAIILITNRGHVLDPAVLRRSSLHIRFGRPGKDAIFLLLKEILNQTDYGEDEILELIDLCLKKKPLFTSSDIIRRIGENALMEAFKSDAPLTIKLVKDIIQKTLPSPEFSTNEQ